MPTGLLVAILQGLAKEVETHPDQVLSLLTSVANLFTQHPNLIDVLDKAMNKPKS